MREKISIKKILVLGIFVLFASFWFCLQVQAEGYGGRIGIQLSDDGCGSQFGDIKYTPWASSGGGWSGWGWASDENDYDADCVQLKLEPETLSSTRKDLKICVQLSDKSPGSHSGGVKCTPWASEGGGWSDWASDDNQYDPDYVKIQLQTRDLPDDKYIKDWRIGIQLSDDACGSQFGDIKYTPWASSGGGWSGWASDSNSYDFDCIRVYLEAQVGTIERPVTISGRVKDNNGNPIGGVRLELCGAGSVTTDSSGYWEKEVTKCQPFCVRIDENSLDAVVPGWISHTPNYECQKAGTYCARSDECDCSYEEKQNDLAFDNDYDFEVERPTGSIDVNITSASCDLSSKTIEFTVESYEDNMSLDGGYVHIDGETVYNDPDLVDDYTCTDPPEKTCTHNYVWHDHDQTLTPGSRHKIEVSITAGGQTAVDTKWVTCEAEDTTPPTVNVYGDCPVGGGSFAFVADAYDESGIEKIKLYVNGQLKNTCNYTSRCSYTITDAQEGETYHLEAKAWDNSPNHNMGTADKWTTCEAPPEVYCGSISCDSNSVVTAKFIVDSKDGSIRSYELQGKIDNSSWGGLTEDCPITYYCDPDSARECCLTYSQSGNFFLVVLKYKGEPGHDYNARLRVKNNTYDDWSDWGTCGGITCEDTTPPTVNVYGDCPIGGGSFAFIADADDESGIEKIKLYVNGQLKNTCHSTSSCSYTIPDAQEGETYHLEAKAWDNSPNHNMGTESKSTTCEISEAPEVEISGCNCPAGGGDFTVTATVLPYPSGIKTIEIWYKEKNEDSWNFVNSCDNTDTCSGTITGEPGKSYDIQAYVEANNGSSNYAECSTTCSELTCRCTGSLPAHSSPWGDDEDQNLSQDLPWQYSDSDTARKCEFHCDTGYEWDGSSCVEIPPTPTCDISSLNINPSEIKLGQTATISWSTENCSSCTASVDPDCPECNWQGSKPVSGSQEIRPENPRTYTFTLTCSGEGGSTSEESATLKVYRIPWWEVLASKLIGIFK